MRVFLYIRRRAHEIPIEVFQLFSGAGRRCVELLGPRAAYWPTGMNIHPPQHPNERIKCRIILRDFPSQSSGYARGEQTRPLMGHSIKRIKFDKYNRIRAPKHILD